MTPYFETDLGKIYHGDNLEIMPELKGIDIVITSPPYNMGISSGGGIKGAGKKGFWKSANNDGGLGSGYDSYGDKMPWDKYEEWQKLFLNTAWGTLSEAGAIFYNHKPRCQDGIVRLPTQYNPGLPLRQIITWIRSGGFNFSASHYLPSYEWILLFAKENFRLKSKGASGISDVWRMTPKVSKTHPCPFPCDLPSNVLNTTLGETILDPFGGEGTTAIACERHNRKWILIENSEKYCESAAKLIGKEKQQGTLFGEAQPRKQDQYNIF